MTKQSQSKNSLHKFAYIDALRGYAVFGVILVHSLSGIRGIPGSQLFGLGAKGVQLFYIVSAFTLFLSFHRRRSEHHKTTNFFIRRFFRIAPLFYVAIFYYLLQYSGVYHPHNLPQEQHIGSIASHIGLFHGLNPYWMDAVVPGGWSVGVEVLFYAMCPVLFLTIKNQAQAIGFWAISYCFGQVLFFYLTNHPLIEDERIWGAYLYSWLPNQLHVFAAGILVYFLIHEKAKIQFWPIVSILILFVLVNSILNGIYSISEPAITAGLNINLFVSIIFSIGIITLQRGWLSFLVNPLAQLLGRLSYSIYLTHFAVLHWIGSLGIKTPFQSLLPDYLFRVSLTLVVSSLVSYVTFRIIEQHGIMLGKSIIKNRELRTTSRVGCPVPAAIRKN